MKIQTQEKEYQKMNDSAQKIITKPTIKNVLSEQEQYLADLLMNKVLFQELPIDDTVFQPDLVIRIKLPNQMYCKRSENIEIGSLIHRPTKKLYNAYTAAFKNLYRNMEEVGDDIDPKITEISEKNLESQLRLRNISSFIKVQQEENSEYGTDNHRTKDRKVDKGLIEHKPLTYNCQQQYTGVLDAFIIQFNTLIYTMQHECGFIVRSYMISKEKQGNPTYFQQIRNQNIKEIAKRNDGIQRQIFILLHIPPQNILKVANNFGIKKELDYARIDPFINEPMDKTQRPLRNHSKITKNNLDNTASMQEQDGNFSTKRINKNQSKKQNEKQSMPKELILRKQLQRKLGFIVPPYSNTEGFINEENLKKKHIENYMNFTRSLINDMKKLTKQRNQPLMTQKDMEESISEEEKAYLYFLNRGKLNPGILKTYYQVSQQKKYIKQLGHISKYYGYTTFQYPEMFVEFKLASKNKGFFDRLKEALLYKPHFVSPYRQIALFNKMERTKLAYLTLKQHIRIQNFSMFNADLFALNDDFEKYGSVGDQLKGIDKYYSQYIIRSKEEKLIRELKAQLKLKGGLYQSTLDEKWCTIAFWNTDFKAIRGYMGEAEAYQIFIKVKLLEFFAILSVFGIAGELVKHLIIKPQANSYNYIPQVGFYLAYLMLATIIYAGFMEIFTQRQKIFLQNYQQKRSLRTFRYQYRGPYIRNYLSDNINDYSIDQISLTDKIITFLFFVLVLILIGAEIGFYYSIRYFIIQLSHEMPEFNRNIFYVIYPSHFVGYSIYFFCNEIISRLLIRPFFTWLTTFENWPSEDGFDKSVRRKIYLFLICVELIPPIDLVMIQYASKTYCSAFWCFKQMEAYVYSRYLAYIGIIIFKVIKLIVDTIRTNAPNILQSSEATHSFDFSKKLANFLSFVYSESKKEPKQKIEIPEETINLLDFCTFLTIFPLGSFLSFILLYLSYFIERRQVMSNIRRPISKSQEIQRYSEMIRRIIHWMIFFNISQMIILLEWMEYVFQEFMLMLLPQPTFYTVMLVKYIVIILVMVIYEVVAIFICWIVRSLIDVMQARKKEMYKKFIETRGHKQKYNNLQIRLPKPLITIARTFNQKIKRVFMEEDIKIKVKKSLDSSSEQSSSSSSQD